MQNIPKYKVRTCKTVGALIKLLEQYPKSLPLSEGLRPALCNHNQLAKELGLKKCLYIQVE